jgi:biotin carboxyl carrier protein
MNTYMVSVNGTTHTVVVQQKRGDTLDFQIEGETYSVRVARAWQSAAAGARAVTPAQAPASTQSAPRQVQSTNDVRAPIPGIVSDIKVTAGDVVEAGATLVVIEAMKMENPIRAPRAGVIEKIHIAKGQEVGNGAPLITFAQSS